MQHALFISTTHFGRTINDKYENEKTSPYLKPLEILTKNKGVSEVFVYKIKAFYQLMNI